MGILKKLGTLIRNPHIYTALIAAGIILGAAVLFKTPENKDFMIILFGAVASAQIVISSYLTKSHKKKGCKRS